MKKKRIIAQSIIWATAILVNALVNDKQFATLMLTVLATVAVMSLQKEP